MLRMDTENCLDKEHARNTQRLTMNEPMRARIGIGDGALLIYESWG